MPRTPVQPSELSVHLENSPWILRAEKTVTYSNMTRCDEDDRGAREQVFQIFKEKFSRFPNDKENDIVLCVIISVTSQHFNFSFQFGVVVRPFNQNFLSSVRVTTIVY